MQCYKLCVPVVHPSPLPREPVSFQGLAFTFFLLILLCPRCLLSPSLSLSLSLSLSFASPSPLNIANFYFYFCFPHSSQDNPWDYDPAAQVWGCRDSRGCSYNSHWGGTGKSKTTISGNASLHSPGQTPLPPSIPPPALPTVTCLPHIPACIQPTWLNQLLFFILFLFYSWLSLDGESF